MASPSRVWKINSPSPVSHILWKQRQRASENQLLQAQCSQSLEQPKISFTDFVWDQDACSHVLNGVNWNRSVRRLVINTDTWARSQHLQPTCWCPVFFVLKVLLKVNEQIASGLLVQSLYFPRLSKSMPGKAFPPQLAAQKLTRNGAFQLRGEKGLYDSQILT